MPEGLQPETKPGNPPVNLEAQGRSLAEDHRRRAQVSPGVRTGSSVLGQSSTSPAVLLSARLPRFTSILEEATSRLQAQTSKAGQLSPAAEWLLDNYYIAAQALREVQQDLPPHYERQLPRLQAGHPRIYELSAEIIQTESALLDLGHVQRFVESYEEVLSLTMGELWALPTMLRIGLLECLLAAIARLTGLAAEADSEITPFLTSPGQLDDQLIVENSIRSLRSLAVYDWKRFFEILSLVDVSLRQDPAGLYTGMDFETRDLYRKAVEEIANDRQVDELVVARSAVSLARAGIDQLSPQPAPVLQEPPDAGGYKDLGDQPDGWDGFRSQLERAYRILSPGTRPPGAGTGCRVHAERLATIEAFDSQPPCSTLPGVDCMPLAGIGEYSSGLCRCGPGASNRTPVGFCAYFDPRADRRCRLGQLGGYSGRQAPGSAVHGFQRWITRTVYDIGGYPCLALRTG